MTPDRNPDHFTQQIKTLKSLQALLEQMKALCFSIGEQIEQLEQQHSPEGPKMCRGLECCRQDSDWTGQ